MFEEQTYRSFARDMLQQYSEEREGWRLRRFGK
jgi:hypothetical protein